MDKTFIPNPFGKIKDYLKIDEDDIKLENEDKDGEDGEEEEKEEDQDDFLNITEEEVDSDYDGKDLKEGNDEEDQEEQDEQEEQEEEKYEENGKKIHVCRFKGCNLKFSRPSRLRNHSRVHTGQHTFR